MTHFLAAGFIFDQIDDIGRGLGRLEGLFEGWRSAAAGGAVAPAPREFDEAGRVVAALVARCREARRTIETLESEPLIYTGSGTTYQVIAMLEGLMAPSGEDEPTAAPLVGRAAAPAGRAAAPAGRAAAPAGRAAAPARKPAAPASKPAARAGKAMARAAPRRRRVKEG